MWRDDMVRSVGRVEIRYLMYWCISKLVSTSLCDCIGY